MLICTVWPELLAGRYIGGLLKICYLAQFTDDIYNKMANRTRWEFNQAMS